MRCKAMLSDAVRCNAMRCKGNGEVDDFPAPTHFCFDGVPKFILFIVCASQQNLPGLLDQLENPLPTNQLSGGFSFTPTL